MPNDDTYSIPAATHRVEQEIKRSRFIATLGRADGAEEAVSFIAGIRAEFPDAGHHCWAYVAGPPGNTLAVGMSDDGEPHGTAGRPMLSVLQQNSIGEIVAVVTRYWGGTKLGAGGLVRAYSGSVALALAHLPVMDRITRMPVRIQLAYHLENPVRHLLGELSLDVGTVEYRDLVMIQLSVPTGQMDTLAERIQEVTAGAVNLEQV